jgi:hypothetical protein
LHRLIEGKDWAAAIEVGLRREKERSAASVERYPF